MGAMDDGLNQGGKRDVSNVNFFTINFSQLERNELNDLIKSLDREKLESLVQFLAGKDEKTFFGFIKKLDEKSMDCYLEGLLLHLQKNEEVDPEINVDIERLMGTGQISFLRAPKLTMHSIRTYGWTKEEKEKFIMKLSQYKYGIVPFKRKIN